MALGHHLEDFMTTHISPPVTVDDLDLMPDDDNRYEVIEGEIFMSRAQV